MGTDIHCVLERYNKEADEWENLRLYKKVDGTHYDAQEEDFEPVDIYDKRDYQLFGILAGVRGSSGSFVVQRGLPDNLSDFTKEYWGDGDDWHTPTWYDYCELSAYSYMLEQSIKRDEEKVEFIKSILLEDDERLELIVDDYEETKELSESVQSFMRDIDYVLDAYEVYKPKPNDVRVILWFDN